MSVAQIVSITPKSGREADVEGLLRRLVDGARREEGTLLYVLNRRDDGFVLYEMYADEDAMTVHNGNPALHELVGRAAELLAAGVKAERVSYLDGTAELR